MSVTITPERLKGKIEQNLKTSFVKKQNMLSVYVVLLGIALRSCVSLFPYSGYQKPPMFGDYEAQRHWQEITVNLPVQEWYTNGTSNDLLYWGLDYPPLTAYHSYMCGLFAKIINPEFVELHFSRGYESQQHKLFMRLTVLVSDIIVYFIPCFLFSYCFDPQQRISTFAVLILSPSLILIDYGHFQYNCVSLGLFIAAVTLFMEDSHMLGSSFFVLSLNYKQMELYHALPIFFYLLGKCWKQTTLKKGILKFALIGITVIGTFCLCWAPFLSSITQIAQVFKRIFPLNRGLFEDKVANIWCSLSVAIKFKSLVNYNTMALICLASTALLVSPSCFHLFLNPNKITLIYSLVNSSLIFFLFSYHVHEKSILLALLPICMIFQKESYAVVWFTLVATFSMLPLLNKDKLFIPTLCLSVITYLLYSSLNRNSSQTNANVKIKLNIVFNLSLTGLVVLCLCTLIIEPPEKLPDIFSMLISIYSCLHFCAFCVYFHIKQFNVYNYFKKYV